MHFELGDEKFIVTIKRALSEQSVKVLLGELVIIPRTIVRNEHPRKVDVLVVLMYDARNVKQEAFVGYQETLMKGIAFLSNDALENAVHAVRLHVAHATPIGCTMFAVDDPH
jgi:hypothetical protein